MAMYLKSRYKLGRHTSLVRFRKLDGKPLLKLLFSPILLVIWIFMGAFMLISWCWSKNSAVTKLVLAGLSLISGLSTVAAEGKCWNFMTFSGIAVLLALWGLADLDKRKQRMTEVSDFDTD